MIKYVIPLIIISATIIHANVAKSDAEPENVNIDGPPTLSVISEARFVGFSNNTVSADVGLVGMHDACRSAYGVSSRMCLDIEVFKTPGLRSIPSVTKGWLQPTSYLSGDNPASLSCNGWSENTGGAASWLTGNMQIKYGSKHNGSIHCENHFPVACCR
jgi:hypothetical protein